MSKYELSMWTVSLNVSGLFQQPSGSAVWTKKHPKHGITYFDLFDEMAGDGWQLISVTPIAAGGGHTGELLFCFQRPLDQE